MQMKLAQSESNLRKVKRSFSVNGSRDGSGNVDFLASVHTASAMCSSLSPPEAGVVCAQSLASTIVWIETQKGEPYQMHVQQDFDFQFQSHSASENTPTSGASLVGSQALYHDEQWQDQQSHLSKQNHFIPGQVAQSGATYVAQLDGVIVAMEFVLKQVDLPALVLHHVINIKAPKARIPLSPSPPPPVRSFALSLPARRIFSPRARPHRLRCTPVLRSLAFCFFSNHKLILSSIFIPVFSIRSLFLARP